MFPGRLTKSSPEELSFHAGAQMRFPRERVRGMPDSLRSGPRLSGAAPNLTYTVLRSRIDAPRVYEDDTSRDDMLVIGNIEFLEPMLVCSLTGPAKTEQGPRPILVRSPPDSAMIALRESDSASRRVEARNASSETGYRDCVLW